MDDLGIVDAFVTIPDMPRGTVVAVVAIVGALAGCSSHVSQPSTLAPLTSATAPTATSTLTTPASSPSPLGTVFGTSVPTAAPTGDPSEMAAITTAQAWISAEQATSVLQDLAPVRALADPGCPCLDDAAQSIQLQKQRKHHAEVDPLTPMRAAVTSHVDLSITVRVDYVATAYRLLEPDGKVVATGAAEPIAALVSMKYDGSMWRVTGFEAAK
jgi:hypothetical protein